jgi:tetrahydromethanopterin S-methyltransferase subunit H
VKILLEFKREQNVVEIGNVKLGGQPGENSIVLIGSVFYARHKALLDEKEGKIDKNIVEEEVNEFISIVDENGMQAIIDVVGASSEALLKECEYIADLVDCPFLVDGLNDSSRIPAMKGLQEKGLIDRAILNSIDENTSSESLETMKNIGVKYAVLLSFGSRYIFPHQKLQLLQEKLIPNAQKANIENIIVDTAVLDLPSMGINVETTRLVKKELGIPTGFAPANAIYGWNFVKKYGDTPRCGAIASVMTYCASAGSDYVLFGPVKFAKCIVPSIALISGINSYYRKRILRKPISEKSPFKHIF